MMEFIVPKDVRKLKQKIKVLEELIKIKNDTNEKDRNYYQVALNTLKQKLNELQKNTSGEEY